jgi:hypothetical protein
LKFFSSERRRRLSLRKQDDRVPNGAVGTLGLDPAAATGDAGRLVAVGGAHLADSHLDTHLPFGPFLAVRALAAAVVGG